MSTRRLIWFVLAALCALVLTAGCAQKTDFSARFMRYDTLPDGQRVAVVQRVAADDPSEVRAVCEIDDLAPGEVVYIAVTGRDWDEPQWTPEMAVVKRAPIPEGR